MSLYSLGSMVLSFFYIAMAVLALRPQVSADYAAYYILRTSAASPGELKRDRSAGVAPAGVGSAKQVSDK